MPEKNQQEKPLSERVVKEAVGVGMDTPLREPILEAVEEAEGTGTDAPAKRTIPAAGALVGLGAALGYLLGRSDMMDEESNLEALEDLDFSSDTDEETLEVGTTEESADTELEDEEATEEPEAEAEPEETGGSRLRRLAVVLGLAGAIAVLWRRRQADEAEEWEPIEEFEPAVDAATEFGLDTADEGEDESEDDDHSAADDADDSDAADGAAEDSEETDEEELTAGSGDENKQ